METNLRRKILDTTRHLLVQDGYKSLSMRKIARAIDYSPTSIYLHFDSKDALIHALIDEGMGRLYDALDRAVATCPEEPVFRLEALCTAYLHFGLDNPEYYEIMFMLHPEHMERYPVEKYRRARRGLDLFARTITEAEQEGVTHTGDARVLANTSWAALHGAVSLLLARRVDVHIDTDSFVSEVVAQVLRSVTLEPVQPDSSIVG